MTIGQLSFGLPRQRVAIVGIVLIIFGSLLTGSQPASANTVLPTQYLSKLYSEAFGRVIDQNGWTTRTDYFIANGCNASTLRYQAHTVFASGEYNSLGYDNNSRVLTLYRAILNREPDPSGFNNFVSHLNNGVSINTVIDWMTASPEYDALVNKICGTPSSYGWGSFPAIAIPTSGSGFTGSQSQLQALLNSTPSGGTVVLAQKAVVSLTSQLVVPAGVTLTTTGAPPANQYAKMGRLVRNFFTGGKAAVVLKGSAKLKNVWVDGQRTVNGSYDTYGINVALHGGNGTSVVNSRSDNSQGWSSIVTAGSEGAVGALGVYPCTSNTISGNLVTSYSSSHYDYTWSDGISNACENATITNNTVIDATDVGIIIFEANTVAQRSLVKNNTVVNLGNSAFGGLAADPLRTSEAPSVIDFTGSSITENLVWTGPRSHIDIVLAVGTKAWFGGAANTGTGASFTNNTVGAPKARAHNAVVVSGMLNATVTGNAIDIAGNQITASYCPAAVIGASVSAGYASGNIQTPYTDTLFSGCIGAHSYVDY